MNKKLIVRYVVSIIICIICIILVININKVTEKLKQENAKNENTPTITEQMQVEQE